MHLITVWFMCRCVNRIVSQVAQAIWEERYGDGCHSPSIGAIVMATPTKVTSQRNLY